MIDPTPHTLSTAGPGKGDDAYAVGPGPPRALKKKDRVLAGGVPAEGRRGAKEGPGLKVSIPPRPSLPPSRARQWSKERKGEGCARMDSTAHGIVAENRRLRPSPSLVHRAEVAGTRQAVWRSWCGAALAQPPNRAGGGGGGFLYGGRCARHHW